MTRVQAEVSNPPVGAPFQAAVAALREQLAQAIVGQTALLDRMVIDLLTGGHLLVRGYPAWPRPRR
ncbi:MAG: hypothetical protein KGL51_14635 [Betaproteobacteria bacterium]|nr:hypothetical protein [Betaproteobacteria bacterium]MDE2123849.1 hypothetical protein [Betaproteobacteria bacterium]MDE2187973.1 hypothetical protein [Betaproteobacteria bacterium]MDE2325885.1 hypothetical protein [Betaproteobacteria bacterium]